MKQKFRWEVFLFSSHEDKIPHYKIVEAYSAKQAMFLASDLGKIKYSKDCSQVTKLGNAP